MDKIVKAVTEKFPSFSETNDTDDLSSFSFDGTTTNVQEVVQFVVDQFVQAVVRIDWQS